MEELTAANPECEEAWVGNLDQLVQFADRGTVSKTLVECPKAKLVLFGMKSGQSISGHAAGTPATIHVLRGTGTVTLGETEYKAEPGALYYLPAGLFHALKASEDFVFLLNLFR